MIPARTQRIAATVAAIAPTAEPIAGGRFRFAGLMDVDTFGSITVAADNATDAAYLAAWQLETGDAAWKR